MRPLTRTAPLAVAALLLAACGHTGPPPPGPAPSQRVVTAAPTDPASAPAGDDWITYHRDNARTGTVTDFPAVGTARVGWRARLDGAVYGQPLVVGGTAFAATENDTIYALDPTTGAVRWSAHLGTPMPRRDLPCGNIDPLGITSTMAYDPVTRLLFALAESTGAHHTLYGLRPDTGAVAVTRAAEPPHGGPVAHQQRSALTVLDGRVYVAYGGLAGDCARYIGSVVSLPTVGDGPAASYAVPTSREGGIWAPGGSLVHNGRLLYAVGNGESTGTYDGSDSVIALTPLLTLADRFSPSTWAEDNDRDLDLGSMSPAVVGGYVFIAGKRGTGYTLRADRFGGVGGQVAQADACRSFGTALVRADTVYLPCDQGTTALRIDPAGGIHKLWHTVGPAAAAPVLGGGALWTVNGADGTLYLLDPDTGTVRQRLNVEPMPRFTSPTLAAGHAFLGTLTGVVAVSPS